MSKMGGRLTSWATGSTDGAPVTICSGVDEVVAVIGGGDALASPEIGAMGEES